MKIRNTLTALIISGLMLSTAIASDKDLGNELPGAANQQNENQNLSTITSLAGYELDAIKGNVDQTSRMNTIRKAKAREEELDAALSNSSLEDAAEAIAEQRILQIFRHRVSGK